jgi:peptidoglycan/LPS O-acetylase OafA/YrhL
MGVIRLLLALAVMIGHMGPFPGYTGLDGGLAVKFFFMISGFYMTMILVEKYGCSGPQRRAFFKSRALRIYPLYLTVLALTLLASLVLNHRSEAGALLLLPTYADRGVMNPLTKALFWLSNVSLLGISPLSFFSAVNPATGGLRMTLDVYGAVNPGYSFFPIPQAWTLDLELVFYGLAPFVLQDKKKIAALLALSLFLNALFWGDAFGERVLYNILPAQLWIFLLGAFAYYQYTRIAHVQGKSGLSLLAFFAVLGAVGFLNLWPGLGGELCGLALLFVCLPYVFKLTKHVRWDRAVGELSYPVYLCHFLVLAVLEAMNGAPLSGSRKVFAALLVLGFSALLHLAVSRPIDRYRTLLAPSRSKG